MQQAKNRAAGGIDGSFVLPAGYAIAGPVANVIGMSTSLWIGVAWIVLTTLVVISVRDVKDFRLEAAGVQAPELAPATATS